VQLAKILDGEIISADSRLFYRGMDIGTAKPTAVERSQVPHHLVDVARPDEPWSLALFQNAAREVIADIHKRGKLPFLVGGTGQYIRAVTEGWQPPAQQPVSRLRQALEQWAEEISPAGLHARLVVIDPDAASRILPGNLRRTVRALEVIFSTGQRFSTQQHKTGSPYSLLQIGLTRPRVELYARIDARINNMLQNGFVEEVKQLLSQGYAPELPGFSAIGYREIGAHVRGELTLEEAVTQMKRLTRQFVRRQANWFKLNDPGIRWFNASSVEVGEIIQYIHNAQSPSFVLRDENNDFLEGSS
jgi:tRNA dimethylallyltransferase